ncbi:MAG: TonB-dependent receptor plug domain-containing protein [Desulfohalobiaceae bacterium]
MCSREVLSSILLGVLLLIPGLGFAQTDAETAYDLGEVVVAGKRTGVEDIGMVQELDSQAIQAAGSKTLAEALRFAPGIIVTRGAKNEPEISVHGFGTEKSLFLIDGIPYYETYYGKLNLDQIPTNMISRIEISKNAPSVLYGANTQIAVINVVTKKGTKEPSLNVTAEIGENDTYNAQLSHGNQIGNINYWLSYSRQETDGWRLSDDFDPEPAQPARPFMGGPKLTEDGGFRNNADSKQDAFWGRVGISPNQDSEYYLSMHVMQSEKGMPFNTEEYRIFDTRGDEPGFSNLARFENYDDWGMDFSGKQQVLSWLTLRGKLFYHEHTDDYVSYADTELDQEIAKSTYDDQYIGGSLISDFELVPWHAGHISVHYKKDVHEDRAGRNLPFNEFEAYTGSVGTEHEFFSAKGLTWVVGASYDWFEVTSAEETEYDKDYNYIGQSDMQEAEPDAELNPMAGLSWDVSSDTRAFGSVAKKTRFPTLSQLYSGSSGNPDLDSERSINYTLGVRHSIVNNLHLRLEGFFHDISDWISRDYYEEDYWDDIYVNIEDVEMLGAELGVEYTPLQDISLSLDYTYNDAKNVSDESITDKVSGVPENKYTLAVDAMLPKIETRLNLRGIYVDKIYEDLPTPSRPDTQVSHTSDYFIVNARLSKDLNKHFSVYIECENLLDKDYQTEIGFPGPGRNALLGMKARF